MLMPIVLLLIIYIVFISLGLPDGVLGGAWPSIHTDLNVPIGFGGVIALVITTMTIISSLSTAALTKQLGIGVLMVLSTLLTSFALFGFSQSSSIVWLCLLAVPLGLGAGAIDSALNHYVATRYEAHHMNWLHAFWGLGATLGPILFSFTFRSTGDWHQGYLQLGLIQACIVALLVASVFLWARVHPRHLAESGEDSDVLRLKFRYILRDKAVRYTFLAFLLYVGIEVGIGIWLATYLVAVQNIAIPTAALWAGIYYGSITLGRIVTGVLSLRIGSDTLVRYGLYISLAGILLLTFALGDTTSILGIILIGAGMAPVYPSLIHMTPERFGEKKSEKIMSLQMVGGYVGASVVPPLIGLLSGLTSVDVFAYLTVVLFVGLIVANRRVRVNLR